MRELDIRELTPIGKGGLATVFDLKDGKILKLFTEKTTLSEIMQEARGAEAAYEAGIPTARFYEMVRCGNAYGLVFEKIEGRLLAEVLQEDPSRCEDYAIRCGKILKNLHTAQTKDGALVSVKEIYAGYVDQLSKWYEEDEILFFREFVAASPEGRSLLHTDFHTKNLMLRDNELLLIDMAEFSFGHPIFDLSATYDVFVGLAKRSPKAVPMFTGISTELATQFWNLMMNEYLGTKDQDKHQQVDAVCESFSRLRIALSPAIYAPLSDQTKMHRVERTRELFLSQREKAMEDIHLIGEVLPC